MITVSIVSHGHYDYVLKLVEQISSLASHLVERIIITSNSPELDIFPINLATKFPIDIVLINNVAPRGYGVNHNAAFAKSSSDLFCVLNPDIKLIGNPFQTFALRINQHATGLTYPSQISDNGTILDFQRELVSLNSIVARHFFKHFNFSHKNIVVHWINGAFMVFRSSVFRELGGFDERYYMYCEDVDICLRLQLAGYKLAKADATVIHHTQRRTLKSFQHLAWHVRSLLRLWNSDAYKQYKQRFIDNKA